MLLQRPGHPQAADPGANSTLDFVHAWDQALDQASCQTRTHRRHTSLPCVSKDPTKR
jgi:hypothetical protein